MAAKRASRTDATKTVSSPGGAGTGGRGPRDGTDSESLYGQIADRAYYIWLEHGKPDHGAWEFWFQAEAEVIREYVDRCARPGT